MTERPILFNGEMVRAILDGRKTQTRRLVDWNRIAKQTGCTKGKLVWSTSFDSWAVVNGNGEADMALAECPFGRVGDTLWVRETTRMRFMANLLTGEPTTAKCAAYDADGKPVLTDDKGEFDIAWWYSRNICPAIHMPRLASRITLEITEARVQRVQEITHDEIKAEGVTIPSVDGKPLLRLTGKFPPGDYLPPRSAYDIPALYRAHFASLWDSCGYNWDANPWVWAITFKRIKP